MAALPTSVIDPIADAIFSQYKIKYGAELPRPYLGASSIGKSCSRALWFQFRWAKPAEFSGRMYRLFQTGHLQEPRINDDLRAIGVTVYEFNPSTGKQWSFSELATGHHFRGNCDAIVIGLPQAPKAPHVGEYKTHSAKSYKKMQDEGVVKAKPEHFAQLTVYMKWTQDMFGADGCKRAVYIAVNKDTDEIYTERLEYDAKAAQALVDKALAIINATEPPQGISTDPTYYLCKFCDYASMCHGTDVPAPNCRSCAHATPELDGDARWSCQTRATDLSLDQQRAGCDKHLYIPILLHKTAKPIDGASDWVKYQTPAGDTFVNGPSGFSSAEIHACKDKVMLTDKGLLDLRAQWNGKVVA